MCEPYLYLRASLGFDCNITTATRLFFKSYFASVILLRDGATYYVCSESVVPNPCQLFCFNFQGFTCEYASHTSNALKALTPTKIELARLNHAPLQSKERNLRTESKSIHDWSIENTHAQLTIKYRNKPRDFSSIHIVSHNAKTLNIL